jgi:F0F1-type ATP synthase delta subunit
MNTNDTFSTLVESLHLSEEIDALNHRLEKWINNGGQKRIDDTVLDAQIYQQLMDFIANSPGIGTTKMTTAEILKELKSLREFLNQIPVIEMAVPFEPEADFKQEVIKHLKGLIQGDFAVRFQVDNGLIAGCQISFKGKFADFSLLKILNDRPAQIFDLGVNRG